MIVDNIIIIEPKYMGLIIKVKIELTSIFEIMDIELTRFYLSLKIEKHW